MEQPRVLFLTGSSAWCHNAQMTPPFSDLLHGGHEQGDLIFAVSMGYLACVHDLEIKTHVHMGERDGTKRCLSGGFYNTRAPPRSHLMH